MNDILGREIKLGDLIITDYSRKNSMVLSKDSFSIAISDKRAYNGSVFMYGSAYLIENPTEREIKIKEDLKLSYSNYMIMQAKKEESNRQRAKENREKFKNMEPPKIGDMFSYCGAMYIYLGVCEVKIGEESINEGHTYVPISWWYFNSYFKERVETMQKFEKYIQSLNNEITLTNLFKYGLDTYSRNVMSKTNTQGYVSLTKNIVVSKSLSMKFKDVYRHIDLTDWKPGSVILISSAIARSKYRSDETVVSITNIK